MNAVADIVSQPVTFFQFSSPGDDTIVEGITESKEKRVRTGIWGISDFHKQHNQQSINRATFRPNRPCLRVLITASAECTVSSVAVAVAAAEDERVVNVHSMLRGEGGILCAVVS